MNDPFLNKLRNISGIAVLVILSGLLTVMASVEIKDLDLWRHLGVGQYIIVNGAVPKIDIVSCTMAGESWINHQWLFQAITASINNLAGLNGVIILQVIIVILTFILLLFMGYRRERHLLAVLMLLLVIPIYRYRFTIRPDLFSLLYLMTYVYILFFHINKKWSPWVLIFLQVIWTNTHGFFMFGPAMIFVFWMGESVKRRCKLPYQWNDSLRINDESYLRLKYIFLGTAAGCIFNPNLFAGALYPVGVLWERVTGESGVFFNTVLELRRPIQWDNALLLSSYPFYKILILVSSLSFLLNRKKLDITKLFIWAVFLLFSLSAIRNMVYFAFIAYFSVLSNASERPFRDLDILKIIGERQQKLALIFLNICIASFLLLVGSDIIKNGYYDMDTYEWKSEYGGVSKWNFPQKAVDFLVENRIKGNFFNDFNSGAYLVGRTFPYIKVFFDGRTEFFGSEFYSDYKRMWKGDKDIFDSSADKYKLTGAFLNSIRSPIPPGTLSHLYNNKEWVPVYFDHDAVIFLRDVPDNQEVIRKHRVDFRNWKPKTIKIEKFDARYMRPYQNIGRAESLLSMGLDSAAIEELKEAVRAMPNYKKPYSMLGKIYFNNNSYNKAHDYFKLVVNSFPDDREARFYSALIYFSKGDLDHAVEERRLSGMFEPPNLNKEVREKLLKLDKIVKNSGN